MELSSGLSPRRHHADIDHFEIESDTSVPHTQSHSDSELQTFEIEYHHNVRREHHFQSTSALEILNEVIRILRYNLNGFTNIVTFLICPLSAIILSNVLVSQSLVKKLDTNLLLIAQTSGLPLSPFIKQLCYKFSEMTISSIICFPLSISLSLIWKSATIYSVDCTYAKKIFDFHKFYAFFKEICIRLLYTYLWTCVVLVGSSLLFVIFIALVSVSLLEVGFAPNVIIYPVIIFGLVYSIVFANAILICNIALVISVLEEASGFAALTRARVLIKDQIQLGISLVLALTVGLAIVEGLFDHRVKTVSYGDGSSRLWEAPLLVIMYAFVLLIDEMTNTVFYFSCKSYIAEGYDEERQPVLAEAS